jgi:hypothetical protein
MIGKFHDHWPSSGEPHDGETHSASSGGRDDCGWESKDVYWDMGKKLIELARQRRTIRGLASAIAILFAVVAGQIQAADSAHAHVTIRIAQAIAAKNWTAARDALASLEPEVAVIWEQRISAAERGLTPFFEGSLPHIFRVAEGHFAQDTAAARELIQTAVTRPNLLGIDRFGNSVYARVLDSGSQIWAYVREGFIRDAGVNARAIPLDRLVKK